MWCCGNLWDRNPYRCKNNQGKDDGAASEMEAAKYEEVWRKRVGVEPTIRPAKERIAGFEGREDHRTLFAPAVGSTS